MSTIRWVKSGRKRGDAGVVNPGLDLGGSAAEVSVMRLELILAVGMGIGAFLGAETARADVSNLAHFVPPGEFGLAIEPELTLTSGAGLGVNLRYTQGLTDLFNVSGIIGTGSGPRQFRAGADFDFDIFPDLSGQPGIGIAARGLFVRIPTPGAVDPNSLSGEVELTALPYIHKAFATTGHTMIDPFFSLPFGMSFLDGQYKGLVTAVIGSLIQGGEHVWYSTEFGIAINHTETYFAGGVTYYH